jgi:ProP effector
MGFEQLAVLKQQFAEKAPSKSTKAKRRKPVRRPDTSPSAPVDTVVLTIGKLQRRYPKAFPKSPEPKVPLKVGVLQDLLACSTELGLTEKEIRDAMKTWCRGGRYWSCTVAGAARVDLGGQKVGEVSEHDASRANLLEVQRKTRAQATPASRSVSLKRAATRKNASGRVRTGSYVCRGQGRRGIRRQRGSARRALEKHPLLGAAQRHPPPAGTASSRQLDV